VSADKISTVIFQGACHFQFFRGSLSQQAFMLLCKVHIIFYFSHSLAQITINMGPNDIFPSH